jgi:hypothetical protein
MDAYYREPKPPTPQIKNKVCHAAWQNPTMPSSLPMNPSKTSAATPSTRRRVRMLNERHLTTETVQGAALSLQSIDDVERRDGLALGVLGVGDGVTDDTLEEGLENGAGLLVDHGRNTLDTTTASETSDGGLGNTLDVVAKNLAVTLGTTLAEALAALAASSHVVCEGGVFVVVVFG